MIVQRQYLYESIAEEIKRRVREGIYKDGQRLPSEAQLCEELKVSRGSMREALRMLEEEGIITRRQGIGSFVTKQSSKVIDGIEKLRSWTETILRSGCKVDDKVLKIYSVSIEPKIAEKLEVPGDSPGFAIESVRFADDRPLVYCYDLLPFHIGGDLEKVKQRKQKGSVMTFLSEVAGLPPKYYVSTIRAILADPPLDALLQVKPETPLIMLEGIIYDGANQPLAFSQNSFRSDRFEFTLVRS
jgi:GntR family transcriptional regulator